MFSFVSVMYGGDALSGPAPVCYRLSPSCEKDVKALEAPEKR